MRSVEIGTAQVKAAQRTLHLAATLSQARGTIGTEIRRRQSDDRLFADIDGRYWLGVGRFGWAVHEETKLKQVEIFNKYRPRFG
jgi:hypothetical protein